MLILMLKLGIYVPNRNENGSPGCRFPKEIGPRHKVVGGESGSLMAIQMNLSPQKR